MDPTRGPEPPALNYGLKHYVRHTGPGAHASHRACRKTYLKIGESPPLFLGNISKPAVLERAPDWCEGKWKVWKLIKKVRAHIVRLRKSVGVFFLTGESVPLFVRGKCIVSVMVMSERVSKSGESVPLLLKRKNIAKPAVHERIMECVCSDGVASWTIK